MTDDQETGSTAEDPRIVALTRASRAIRVAPLDAARVVRSARARRRRNRIIFSSVLSVAVIGAGVSIVTEGSAPDPSGRVEAVDQSQTPAPTVGCSGMTVASTETRGDDLLLYLRNSGTSDCDVQGLELASPNTMRDMAGADDLRPGDRLSNGPLTPGNAVLVTAATDTCQAAGLPMEVTFSDASTLAFTFPGDLLACNQPGFGIDITAMRTVPVDDGQNPDAQNLTVTGRLVPREPTQPDRALWDATRQVLDYYVSDPPGSCEPIGTATTTATTVNLMLQAKAAICKTPGTLAAVITIDGLTEAPTELTITKAGGTTSTIPVTVAPEVVLLSAAAPSNQTRLARISGPLNLQGDCVSVGPSVAVWPYGTSVTSESPLQVRVPGAGDFTEGDVVNGGATFFDAATDDVLVRIPDSCGTTRGGIINPQSN